MKIGRNDPCVCGSGKKYKKCCSNSISINENQTSKVAQSNKDPSPLFTTTGELFMLCRLEYDVFNRQHVLDKFNDIKCINFDKHNKVWIWTFDEEASTIKLEKKPKTQAPIVIGKISLKDNSFTLDVRSHERAIAAILFFDKYLPQSSAKISDMYVYNKIFLQKSPSDTSAFKINVDKLFHNSNIESHLDFAAMLEKIKAIDDPTERLLVSVETIEQQMEQELSLVEKFPVEFYDTGIAGLELRLSLRKRLLYEHFIGNKTCTFKEIIAELVG